MKNNENSFQNHQYVVFVDGMDGDVYLGLDAMNGAVSHAFLNQAKSVNVKCFPAAKKEIKKTGRKSYFFKKSNWEGKLLGRNYKEMAKDWKEIGYKIHADKVDGDRMVCSADINLKRIHVEVENGIITKVNKIG